jgi:Tfp pilus assembly pilus retraction ATPase PilT
MHSSRGEGMLTLETSLNLLIERQLISFEDATARSLHPKEIQAPMSRTA